VIPVSYTTGSSGHKLTWRPYRPASKTGNPSAPRAERTASFDVPLEEGPSDPALASPFDDPFEDRARLSQAEPADRLRDELLERPQPKLLPVTPFPASVGQSVLPKAESSQQSQPIDGRELEESLAAGPQVPDGKCPSPKDLKPIHKITFRITPERGELPRECPLGEEQFNPRVWEPVTFTWKASALCHKPLYFEEQHLERYGHTVGLGLQPVVSAAHFFLIVPALPYAMGVCPPGECVYTLGYYRPGSCAPYMLDPLPISIRAALWEAGAWTGAAFLFP